MACENDRLRVFYERAVDERERKCEAFIIKPRKAFVKNERRKHPLAECVYQGKAQTDVCDIRGSRGKRGDTARDAAVGIADGKI